MEAWSSVQIKDTSNLALRRIGNCIICHLVVVVGYEDNEAFVFPMFN